jgi:hypothetical protein
MKRKITLIIKKQLNLKKIKKKKGKRNQIEKKKIKMKISDDEEEKDYEDESENENENESKDGKEPQIDAEKVEMTLRNWLYKNMKPNKSSFVKK